MGKTSRKPASTKKGLAVAKERKTAKSNASSTTKFKQEVTPVGFGEADDPPYVVEVHPPKEDDSSGEGCNFDGAGGGGSEDDDVVLVGGSSHSGAAAFVHTRQQCVKHPFAFETRKSMLQSALPYKKNNFFCEKCFCYVCDVPASECKFWCNTAAGQPAHCNAFTSKTTDFWDMRRFMHRNPLIHYFAQLTNDQKQTYMDFKRVRDRVDRAWRLYEAGEVVTQTGKDKKETSVLHHKFTHVTSWFQKFFHSTRIVHDEKEWIQKFVTLDALTEVMVKRSWRPPQHASSDSVWDQSAEKMLDRIMLSLGSRWLTCYAKCDVKQLPRLAEIIRNRMLKLSSQAKEAYIFNRGFSVLRDLASTGVKGDEIRVTKAVCNLYKSILRRRVHHVNLSASDVNAGSKYHEVRLKDGIMLPFLGVLIDRNPCPDEKFVMHAKTLKCQGYFYHSLTVEAWDQLTATVTETKELLSSFRFLAKTVAAPYTYSTRGKLYCEQLTKHVRLLAHISCKTLALCNTASGQHKTVVTLMRECFTSLDVCFNKLEQRFAKTAERLKEKDYKWGLCNSILKHFLPVVQSFESCGQRDGKLYPFLHKTFSTVEESLTKFYVSARASRSSARACKPQSPQSPAIQESSNFADILQNIKRVSLDENGGRFRLVFAKLTFIFKANEAHCKNWMNILESFSGAVFHDLREHGLRPSSDVYKRAVKFNPKSRVMSVTAATVKTFPLSHSKMDVGLLGVAEEPTTLAVTQAASKKRKRETQEDSGQPTLEARPKNAYSGGSSDGTRSLLQPMKGSTTDKQLKETGGFYEVTFTSQKLGINVNCADGTPVVWHVADSTKKVHENISTGDKIHSVNGKYVNDLWRLLPSDMDQETFMLRDASKGNIWVPSDYIAKEMKTALEKFFSRASRPLTVAFYR